MEVKFWIKAVAALGLEPEDAEETQITNAALSEHDYRIGLAKALHCEHEQSPEPLWHWPHDLHQSTSPTQFSNFSPCLPASPPPTLTSSCRLPAG